MCPMVICDIHGSLLYKLIYMYKWFISPWLKQHQGKQGLTGLYQILQIPTFRIPLLLVINVSLDLISIDKCQK